MAKNSIRDYDNTAANNADIDGTDISEGCSPAGMNNMGRSLMAHLADVNDGTVALVSPSFDAATITGDLTVGRTSTSAAANDAGLVLAAAGHIYSAMDGTASQSHHVFINNAAVSATQVGSIATSGSSTSYNTTSDYRLKENITDLDDGIARLKMLQPRRFNFVGFTETVDGFIAHECSSAVPQSVSGDKDASDEQGNPIYQAIDQSKLVPLLTAALQEAVEKIETLETKVAAMEAE